MKTCHTCAWWAAAPNYDRSVSLSLAPKDLQFKCEFTPPSASILIGQGVAGPQPVPITFWPTNAADGRCHFWEKAEIKPILKVV